MRLAALLLFVACGDPAKQTPIAPRRSTPAPPPSVDAAVPIVEATPDAPTGPVKVVICGLHTKSDDTELDCREEITLAKLAEIPNVKKLKLQVPITDAAKGALTKYAPNLEEVDLGRHDFNLVDGHRRLKRVWVGREELTKSAAVLGTLPALTELHVGGFTGELKTLDDLLKAPNLEELELGRMHGFTDLRPLGKLVALKALDLEQTDAKELTGLETCTNLDRLRLAYMKIQSLAPIANHPNLTVLSISYSEVKNIASLGVPPKLKILDLDGTPITDATHLAKLTTLESVSIYDSKISKLDVFAKLPALKYLKVSTTVSKAEIAKLKKARKDIDIDVEKTTPPLTNWGTIGVGGK